MLPSADPRVIGDETEGTETKPKSSRASGWCHFGRCYKKICRISWPPELLLASVTLPQFRLRWLDESKISSCRSLLYEHTRMVSAALQEGTEHNLSASSPSQEEDFFSFIAQDETTDSNTSEGDAFLSDPCKELTALHKIPTHHEIVPQIQYPTAIKRPSGTLVQPRWPDISAAA